LVVLLPDPDGKVGQIEVDTGSAVRVISNAYHASPLDGAPAPAPEAIDPAEIERRFGRTLSAHPDSRFRLSTSKVFCRWDSAELSEESGAQLPGLARSIRSLNPVEIYLVGHTDGIGSEAYNLDLSRRRALGVKTLFLAAGIHCPMVMIAYGKSKPLVGQGENAQPFNRRVEIVVKYPRPERE
jgi:outer membrane protein OmpA-like peptidoglycan-associated protein